MSRAGEPPGQPVRDRERALLEAVERGQSGPHLAGDPAPATSDPKHVRAGYLLTGEAGASDFAIQPALALTLARLCEAGQPAAPLAERFVDLWGLDMALWRAIERGADARELAGLWLHSPAYQLVFDLGLLHTPPSLARLLPAVGVLGRPAERAPLADWLAAMPARWRDLHCSVPGLLMQCWQPRDGRVTTALRRLETGSPHTLRGAALAWLLGRAAAQPGYEAGGIHGDLRADLPLRLGAALTEAPADGTFSAELETALLHHAAHMLAADADAGTDVDSRPSALDAWSLARWLGRCITRSPFHSDDPERLALRLQARLPAERPALDGLDPLHPWRLATDGLDLAELTVMAGVVAHYHGPGPTLEPMPQPLVDVLRRQARRLLRPGEEAAEAAFATRAHADAPAVVSAPGNALAWPAPHVAPPWVARRLLTDRRIFWLADAPQAVQRACLDSLQAQPDRFAWLAFGFLTESANLPEATRAHIAARWPDLARAPHTPRALAALAAAGLDQLAPEQRDEALALARQAQASWRPGLLDAHAQAGLRLSLLEHWRAAVRSLLDLAEDADGTPVRERMNGVLKALLQIQQRAAEEPELVAAIRQILAAPPFRDRNALQRQARRLDVDAFS